MDLSQLPSDSLSSRLCSQVTLWPHHLFNHQSLSVRRTVAEAEEAVVILVEGAVEVAVAMEVTEAMEEAEARRPRLPDIQGLEEAYLFSDSVHPSQTHLVEVVVQAVEVEAEVQVMEEGQAMEVEEVEQEDHSVVYLEAHHFPYHPQSLSSLDQESVSL